MYALRGAPSKRENALRNDASAPVSSYAAYDADQGGCSVSAAQRKERVALRCWTRFSEDNFMFDLAADVKVQRELQEHIYSAALVLYRR
ncbi:hypothetical protein JCM14635_37700 [Megalodesulfovibrio paquesii]